VWWFKLKSIVFLVNQRFIITLYSTRKNFSMTKFTLQFDRKLNMINQCHSLALQSYPYVLEIAFNAINASALPCNESSPGKLLPVPSIFPSDFQVPMPYISDK